MKKLILMFAILLSVVSISAQSDIKGIQLGSNQVVDYVPMSLVGEEYTIKTDNLKTGECSAIYAFPSADFDHRRVGWVELDMLKKAMEAKYEVTLSFLPKTEFSVREGWWFSEKDGVEFILFINDYNEFLDLPYEILFFIKNNRLDELYKKEQQEIANKDI